jgi:hypothetical protein
MATTTDRRKAWILRMLNEYRMARQEAEPGTKAEAVLVKFEEAWIREAERAGLPLQHDQENGYTEAPAAAAEQAA